MLILCCTYTVQVQGRIATKLKTEVEAQNSPRKVEALYQQLKLADPSWSRLSQYSDGRYKQLCSANYQWLPTELDVGLEYGEGSFRSYVNNLHPIKDKNLFKIIETIGLRFIPLFERVLMDLKSPYKPVNLYVSFSSWEEDVGGQIKTGIKVIHPVTNEQGVVGFFIIKCAKLIQKDQDMAISFLRIYHNYLQLINANEHDALTGLLNRKSFAEKMMTVLAAQRNTQARASDAHNEAKHCLAMLDIDHFKKVNDKFGHLHGDEVLLLFARLMTQTFRADDQLYRYGGEEFVVFLKNVDLPTGLTILERFRAKLEAFNIPQVGKVTVSIGAVEVNKQDLPTTVVEQADKALYYAKDNGRNQVCAYEKLLQEGKLTNILTSGDIELF